MVQPAKLQRRPGRRGTPERRGQLLRQVLGLPDGVVHRPQQADDRNPAQRERKRAALAGRPRGVHQRQPHGQQHQPVAKFAHQDRQLPCPHPVGRTHHRQQGDTGQAQGQEREEELHQA